MIRIAWGNTYKEIGIARVHMYIKLVVIYISIGFIGPNQFMINMNHMLTVQVKASNKSITWTKIIDIFID